MEVSPQPFVGQQEEGQPGEYIDMSEYQTQNTILVAPDDYTFGMDPFTGYATYGASSLVFSMVWALLWEFLMKSDSNFNSIGYKFNAYMHMMVWSPLGFFYIWSWFLKDNWTQYCVLLTSMLTMVGPYFLYVFTAIQIFWHGTGAGTW